MAQPIKLSATCSPSIANLSTLPECIPIRLRDLCFAPIVFVDG